MAAQKAPHKAKPTRKGRKYFRNYVGRDRRNLTKYVARMKKRGTYRTRKGRKGVTA